MRLLNSRGVWTLLLAVVTVSAAGFLRDGRGNDAEADRITRLVQQLDDDNFATRTAASKELVALGEVALPALRQAAVGQGLEFSRRIERVVLDILLNVPKRSKSIGLELVAINAGEMSMGSPNAEASRRPDEAEHVVRITAPFLLATHEVTQDEYELVMKSNPSGFHAKGPGKDKVVRTSTRWFPVETVSWYDAVEFCNRLSIRDGYEPYYKLADVKRQADAIASADVSIAGGNGYRLPTEAEWEFACRAGTTTAYHFGKDTRYGLTNCKPLMVSSGYGMSLKWPDLGRTARVGTYPPNSLGLCDMHGNVAEWCWDWYDKDYYAQSPKADPSGPDRGTHRVLRGGSWLVSEGSCRSASRFFHAPSERKDYAGFRVARTPGPPRK